MSSLYRVIGILLLSLVLVLVVAACQPVMPVETVAPVAAPATMPEVVGTWEMAVDGAPYFLTLEPDGAMQIAQGSADAAPMCIGSYTQVGDQLELQCEEVDATGCTQTQKASYTVAVTEAEGQPAALHFTLDTVELCTDHRVVLDGMTLTQVTTMAEAAGTWEMEMDGTSYFLILAPDGAMQIAQGSADAAPMCIGSYTLDGGKMELMCEEVDATGCTQTQKAQYSVAVMRAEDAPAELHFTLDTVELCTDHRVVLDGMTLTQAN